MAADVGVKQQNWARWEGDVVTPSAEMIAKICRVHACSADWLLGIDRGTSAAVVVNGSGNAVANGAHAKAKAGPDCKTCPFKQAALEFAAKLPRKR